MSSPITPLSPEEDVVSILLECHSRIRATMGLAVRLGRASMVSGDSLRGVAGHVQRFLGETVPLHEADEEELIVPLLAGRSTLVDRALSTIRREHVEITDAVRHLAVLAGRVERGERSGDLLSVAHDVELHLRVHLDLEEAALFPALHDLGPAERRAIVASMRARTTAAYSMP